MIVPKYWAEARVRGRHANHQITVKRFGWSDISQQDALDQAQGRAQAAYAQIISG